MLFPLNIVLKKKIDFSKESDVKMILEDLGRLFERHKRYNITISSNQVSFKTNFLNSFKEENNEYFNNVEKTEINIEQNMVSAKFYRTRSFVQQILHGILSYAILNVIYYSSDKKFDLIPILMKYLPALILVSIVWSWIADYIKLRKLFNRIVSKIEANELWFPKPL